MTRRIILYAALYGGIGAVVGVLMALYTKDIAIAVPHDDTAPATPITESITTEVTPDV